MAHSGSSITPRHGGLVDDELAALGIRGDDVLDLSVNVNPFGPCEAVQQAVAQASLARYPDPTATPARSALAAWAEVPLDRVVVGNGAVDLMWTGVRALVSRGDRVLVVEPAFSEMRAAAAHAGAEIVSHRTRPERDFALDCDALSAQLAATRPRIVYVCTPSNPSGACTPRSDLERMARRHPDTLFFVDVSFLSLSARHVEARGALDERVVWLRSLTKEHALAGLRVGFAIAPPAVCARIEQSRPPWSVNALAIAAAVAATSTEAERFVDDSRQRLLDARESLSAALGALRLRVHPSDTVFALVDLGGRVAATELRRRLLVRHRVLVRDATSFGLPDHVRIAAPVRGDLHRLVSALREEIGP